MTAGGKCLLALGLLLTVARGAVAQDSLIPVRRDAQVTSVGFRFAGSSSFSDGELGAQLAVKGRGSLYPVRRWLGELPLIPSPGAYRFDPVEPDLVVHARPDEARPLVESPEPHHVLLQLDRIESVGAGGGNQR